MPPAGAAGAVLQGPRAGAVVGEAHQEQAVLAVLAVHQAQAGPVVQVVPVVPAVQVVPVVAQVQLVLQVLQGVQVQVQVQLELVQELQESPQPLEEQAGTCSVT